MAGAAAAAAPAGSAWAGGGWEPVCEPVCELVWERGGRAGGGARRSAPPPPASARYCSGLGRRAGPGARTRVGRFLPRARQTPGLPPGSPPPGVPEGCAPVQTALSRPAFSHQG